MKHRTEFLQSEEWLLFQKSTKREVIPFSVQGFSASGVCEKLPWIGEYLYVPKGPIGISDEQLGSDYQTQENAVQKFIEEAKKRKVKWIRVEPENESLLEILRKNFSGNIVKAPRDIQPRELLVMDISIPEETILSQMKPKTRYNIRLAEKRGVKVFTTREPKYQEAFLDLIEKTSDRKEIHSHPRVYYEKFFDVFPETLCELFIAEYEGKVIAGNLCIFFQDRAIYLHGGSSDECRDVMAPYLLQWKQIVYAKQKGCIEYDLGGVHIQTIEKNSNDWSGITRFKTGFAPKTTSTIFPGTYDMILDPMMYTWYRTLRVLRNIFHV